ncbi:hypothetical protein [Rhodoferax sp.]|uniref:hypothetical protein n=1 Tax=Rhodoferax sp. TaxID=50421 RepID=UPI0025EC8170|nr:hypothetical protein [Rhodoferax sp.]
MLNVPDAPKPDNWNSPLTMVVNTVPSAQEALRDPPGRTRRGRTWLLLIWLVCAAPVIASYLTFYFLRPDRIKSFGELIEPQKEMPVLLTSGLDGRQNQLASLRGQWLLISVAGGACNTQCQQHLYLQRQLRETMGRDKDRIDWVWLVDDQAEVPQALLPALSSALVLRVDAAALAQWLQPGKGMKLSDHLYVVDPLGKWMMRFPADLDVENAAQAKRDLRRLLTASVSWDKPGRDDKP